MQYRPSPHWSQVFNWSRSWRPIDADVITVWSTSETQLGTTEVQAGVEREVPLQSSFYQGALDHSTINAVAMLAPHSYGGMAGHQDLVCANVLHPLGHLTQGLFGVSKVRIPEMPRNRFCKTLLPVAFSRFDSAANQVSTLHTQFQRVIGQWRFE